MLLLEFYANPATNSGLGYQGLTFIGQTTVTTDGNGNAKFSFTLSTARAAGANITATADFGFSSASVFSSPFSIGGTQTLGDAGFEAPSLGAGTFQYDPTGTIWTFTGKSGISGNGSGFTARNPNAPEGAQVGILQTNGSFSQSIFLSAGKYQISFDAAQRLNNHQNFNILVDGNVVGSFTPAGASYAGYSTSTFTVTSGTHTIAFQGVDTAGGDNTAFIDAVNLAPVAPAVANAGFEAPSLGNGFNIDPQGQAGLSRATRESRETRADLLAAVPTRLRGHRWASCKLMGLSARRLPDGPQAPIRSAFRRRNGSIITRTSTSWSTEIAVVTSRRPDPATRLTLR